MDLGRRLTCGPRSVDLCGEVMKRTEKMRSTLLSNVELLDEVVACTVRTR